MFDSIASAYNDIFNVFFFFINLFIFFHILKKLRDLVSVDNEIQGGYIFITGCDSGFGYGAALEFSKKNCFVFAGCLTTVGVKQLEEDDNFKGMAILMDVTKTSDIQTARKIIEEKVGDAGLWCLINNAGIGTLGPIEWMSDEDMRPIMDVNLWGAVNVTKLMLPLIKRARGRVINTTSLAVKLCSPNFAAYSMAKCAFEGFSDVLRREMKPWNVSVHIVAPGAYKTNIYDNTVKRYQELWERQTDAMREEYGTDFINELLQTSKSRISTMEDCPQGVVDAYVHAALSSSPRYRYAVGKYSTLLPLILSLLPTAVGDFIMNKICTVKRFK